MRFQAAFAAAVLSVVVSLAAVGCGDDSGDDPVPDAGAGAGGMTGGSGGMGGSGGGGMGGSGGGGTGGTGGTGGMPPDPAAVAMCVADSFDGVDAACNECMCECDLAASTCGENCWKLSACVYQQCQMMRPTMDQMQCTADYCGGYFADGGIAAGQFSACWAPAKCGNTCGLWFITPLPPAPPGGGEDGGTDDDAGR